jgi:hypothetical protein
VSSEQYGIDLLDEGDWTPERLGQALRTDLAQLEGGKGDIEPRLESSLLRVQEILGHHQIRLILEGQPEPLARLAREVSSVFALFPALPVLRELSLRQRVGVRLDILVAQLLAVQSLPSRGKVEGLFRTGARGQHLRTTVMECLFAQRDGLTTQEVLEHGGIETRQAAHLVLRKLRENGLTVSFSDGQSHRHMLSPSGRRFWAQLRGRALPGDEGTDSAGAWVGSRLEHVSILRRGYAGEQERPSTPRRLVGSCYAQRGSAVEQRPNPYA